jgi:hypothetical protein
MTAEPSSPDTEALVKALQEARADRLKAETGSADFHQQGALGGVCTRNAYTLANVLREHGFEPVIICGGFADRPIGPDGIERPELPRTIAECRDEGNIHYWVETECRTYTLDLAGELPDEHPFRYQPFIARSVPSNYYYLEDGIDYTFNIPP